MRTSLVALSLLLLAACDARPIDGGEGAAQHDGDASLADVPSRGVLAGYEHGRVWGWAQLIGDDQPVHVRIDVDGEPVATFVADQHRDDLVELGLHPTGAAGFDGVIADLPLDAEVDAYIEETGLRLTNAPCVVQGFGPVSSCTEGSTRGWLDGYEDGTVFGWAQIVGHEEPVHVRVEADGELLATALADRPRPDLVAKRLHATGTAGFRLHIGDLPPGATLDVRVAETGEPLMGSPLVVGHAPRRLRP